MQLRLLERGVSGGRQIVCAGVGQGGEEMVDYVADEFLVDLLSTRHKEH